MFYVYLLRSIPNPDQTYIGFTEDLKARLTAHNYGQSPHTSKYKPWELITYLSFNDKARVLSFEFPGINLNSFLNVVRNLIGEK